MNRPRKFLGAALSAIGALAVHLAAPETRARKYYHPGERPEPRTAFSVVPSGTADRRRKKPSRQTKLRVMRELGLSPRQYRRWRKAQRRAAVEATR